MACPFFMPTQRASELLWPHPARLPLGDAWRGQCTAGSVAATPSDSELKECCNLGYARNCPRLPAERAYDAIRFCVACDREGVVMLQYVGEANHLPVSHGTLCFETKGGVWRAKHEDARVQRMAECFLETYLSRRNGAESAIIESDAAELVGTERS